MCMHMGMYVCMYEIKRHTGTGTDTGTSTGTDTDIGTCKCTCTGTGFDRFRPQIFSTEDKAIIHVLRTRCMNSQTQPYDNNHSSPARISIEPQGSKYVNYEGALT